MAKKGIKYTETNSAKISSEEFAGTTQEITVISIPVKAEGKTEQEQIDNALANPNKSEPSDPIIVKFPMKPTAKPTDLKANNISYNKFDLSFKAPTGAKAYTISQNGKVIKYLLTSNANVTVTLENEEFDGKTFKFDVTAYPRGYDGANEQEQINNALASGEGSPKSDELSVTFLERPIIPTNLRLEGLTSEYVKILWDAGSAKGKAWLGHRNNDGDTDPKKATILDYDENKEIILTPDYVGVKSLAGMTIIVYLQEFNIPGEGANDQEKADWLNNSGKALGSEWSEPIEIKFPEK